MTLLQEKPVSKITVKEVCGWAEINRGTFYKHYRDCFDLLEQIEEEALAQLDQSLQNIDSKGFHAVLMSILNTIQTREELFRALSTKQMDQSFINRLVERCFQYMAPIEGQMMRCAFLASGCGGVIGFWLHTGLQESPKTVAAAIESFVADQGLSKLKP